MSEAHQLAREFSNRSRRLIHSSDGSLIADFSPLDGKIRFPKLHELRFQHYFRQYFRQILESKLSVDDAIASACCDADLDFDWAKRYLRSKKYKEWAADRMAELEVAEGITPEFIAMKHKMNIEGKITLSLSQQSSLSELGDRLWPKVQKVEHRVEATDTYSMDELMKARQEVDALEKKLSEIAGPRKPGHGE